MSVVDMEGKPTERREQAANEQQFKQSVQECFDAVNLYFRMLEARIEKLERKTWWERWFG